MESTSSVTPIEEVRQVAIDHHDAVVTQFEDYYRALERDRFANAFAYGRYKIDALLDETLSALPRGSKILDVGCGTGVYLRRFAKMGFEAIGLEPAAGMLAIAREQNADVRVEQGVATAIPFDDASIDAVTAIEVLRYLHIADVQKSISEMLRVLRPGGVFFVTLVNRWALDGFYVLQRLRQVRRRVAFDERHPHCEFTTPREIERLFRGSGASEVHTVGRLLAPIRIAYKANEGVGSRVARKLERLDDRLHATARWPKAFAGHLIAVGRR